MNRILRILFAFVAVCALTGYFLGDLVLVTPPRDLDSGEVSSGAAGSVTGIKEQWHRVYWALTPGARGNAAGSGRWFGEPSRSGIAIAFLILVSGVVGATLLIAHFEKKTRT